MANKLMILGGNPETAVLVETANSMGVYTVVVDPNPNSPAKKYAAESYDIDGFAVDKIVQLARDLKVDGVLVGVADILVKPYKEICDKLNMPGYATTEAVEAFCSKDGFKRYCQEHDIQDIPGIYLDKTAPLEKPEDLEFPLMIKPVDSGGGVGMKISRDINDYKASVTKAFEFSRKGVVLIERYMNCDDMAAYYTFQNGTAYLSAISDRFTTKKQGDSSPVCIGAVFPSKYAQLFIEKVHPKLCVLFKALKIQNGVLNIQFFVENNEFYAYDPGFRLQGEAPHIPIAHINKFDHREMLVNFALTGEFGDKDFVKKNDPMFKGKNSCTIWILLNAGVINSIEGLDYIKSDKDVIFVLERFKKGDIVENDMLGTEKQVFSRIYVAAESIVEINSKIEDFKSKLKILDSDGNDMILEWMLPLNPEEYPKRA